MELPIHTIWDTRLQCVCAVVSARGAAGVELFLCANFAQVSFDPPRIGINPNRLYPIDPLLTPGVRFAVNVLPESRQADAIRLNDVRRRAPRKDEVTGIRCVEGAHGVPVVVGALQTLLCEVETALDTGDHRLLIARVLSRLGTASEQPLLYAQITERSPVKRRLRRVLVRTGVWDRLVALKERYRPSPPADLPASTYRQGGQADAEIAHFARHGLLDTGRVLRPPAAPAFVRKRITVCVVGTHWGQTHLERLRQASPQVELFVCGRDERRAARVAKHVGARGVFPSLDAAATDTRVQALTLSLPHHLHCAAVEQAAAAGKHVLVEKPIANTLAEADRMIEICRRSGVILMVGEDMHFRPAVAEVVRRIERGDVGEPLYLFAYVAAPHHPEGWKADATLAGGGAWMDYGVHYVRAMRLLMGEPARLFATRAMQMNTKVTGEDSIQVIADSPLGWQGHLFFSWVAARGAIPDLVVHGEKGAIHLFPGLDLLDYYPNMPTSITRALSLVRPYWLQEKLTRPTQQRVRTRLPKGSHSGYLGEFREFLAAVAEEREPVTPARDGRRDLEIVLAGYRALATGGWEAVRPAPPVPPVPEEP